MFGKVVNGKLEVAPHNLKLDDGSLIVNFDENETLLKSYGYKEVIENPPAYDKEKECIIMKDFTETDTTITPSYEVVKIESLLEETTDMEKLVDILKAEMLNARSGDGEHDDFGSLGEKLSYMMKYFTPEEIFIGSDLPNDGKYKLWFVMDKHENPDDSGNTDNPNPIPTPEPTPSTSIVVGQQKDCMFVPYYNENVDDTTTEGYPDKLYCSACDASLLGKSVKIFGTSTELDGKTFLINEILPDTALMGQVSQTKPIIGICCKNETEKNKLNTCTGKGIIGVVVSDSAKVATINEGIGLNVRSGTGTTNSKIGYVYDGTKVLILEEYDNTTWIKIYYNGKEGYINGADKYVQKSTIQLDSDGNPVGVNEITRFPSKCKGIDVSRHNGTIDWKKVKEGEEVKFAIIRIGYGSRSHNGGVIDEQFKNNVEACKKYDIPMGVYFFSYAASLTKLKAEANWVIEQLAKYPATFELPIFFDQEYDSLKTSKNSAGNYVSKNPGKSTLTNYMNTFCDMLESAGYKTGIYSNVDWLNNYVNFNDVSKRDLWLAKWNADSHGWTKSDVKVWQNGSSKFMGMNESVDSNICYVDYPSLIKAEKKNGF